jgi:GTP-binding protein HflX
MTNNFKYFVERQAVGQAAVIVNFFIPTLNINHGDERMEEWQALAIAADFNVIDAFIGTIPRIDSKYFMGKGKAHMLAAKAMGKNIQTILINHELTPTQTRNLEKLCKCHVMTRTELILNIFARRAKTFEGKLQVELAHLKHLTTRLTGGWTHLERQRGGIGLRGGAGETQLEMDKRSLNQRIHTLQKRLHKVSVQRKQQRKTRARTGINTIALVGYTNAGKSTLFNVLTQASVVAKDQLFATLDPTIRQCDLPGVGQSVIVDTVGFIQNLPHELVAAFRATLEETMQAQLLLHVVDETQNNVEQTIESVHEVLTQIKADKIPVLTVYNKIDQKSNLEPRIKYNQEGYPESVWVSAKDNCGIDLLIQAIAERLSYNLRERQVTLSPLQAKLRAKLYNLNTVVSETINAQGHWQLTLKIHDALYQSLCLVKTN